MGLKHSHKATGTNNSGSQVSVDRWNEDHVIDGAVNFPNTPSPTTPSADMVAVFGRKIAGRMMLAQVGPSGLDTTYQPNLGGNKCALWMPPGGATTVPGVFGMAALMALGTATARAVAVTNLLTRMTRLGYVSAGTAAALCDAREAVAKYTVGAGGLLGGFFHCCRFGVSDAATVAGARMFVGLSASTAAPTNVNPSTLLNCIGVGQIDGSTNLHIIWGGASANAPIDLGPLFPANTLSADVYELDLFAPSAGGVIHWEVRRLNTGDFAAGSLVTGLPLGTMLLYHQIWRTNNATALAVGIDICGIMIETDY